MTLQKQIDPEEAIDWVCEEVRTLDDADDICTIYNILASHQRVAKVIDNRWVLVLKEIEP